MTDYFQLEKMGLGFDKVLSQLNNAEKLFQNLKLPGWPPYNIQKVDENKYLIELAVAGFAKQNIEIDMANSVLTVKGKIESDTDESTNYLYKGIADRSFSRQFALADTVQVQNAEMINGMLKIFLENIIPEEKKPRKIEINETAVNDSWLKKAANNKGTKNE